MKGIDWIFFDIGSTLVDESQAYEHRFRDAVAGSDISFGELYAHAVLFYKQGKKGDIEALKHYNLPKTEWHSEDEFLYPDAEGILEKLSGKYKLGIIANQNFGTEKRLGDFEILKYFDVVISSAEEGVAKPEPEIFRRALIRAKAKSDRCVMVGDRLDNDIIPAKRLGFKTVWVRQGFARFVPVEFGDDYADFICENIEEIKCF